MRTTIDIEEPILRDLKRLQEREGKTLGQLVSELLAVALAESAADTATKRDDFRWISADMGSRIDLADRDALLDAGDEYPSK